MVKDNIGSNIVQYNDEFNQHGHIQIPKSSIKFKDPPDVIELMNSFNPEVPNRIVQLIHNKEARWQGEN